MEKKIVAWVVLLASVFAGSGAVAQETEAGSLEEIIVTAQKREQRLQEVPISISVLSGEYLDASRFFGVQDALNRVPGYHVWSGMQGGEGKVTVRGVTAGNLRHTGSGVVGYYVDNVPFGLAKSSLVPDLQVYDLERVEALRGPQGTLYGASSLNGVIRILTMDANLDEYEFKARASLSNTDGAPENNYRGDMVVNVPLVPGKLAARAIVGNNDMSGWIDRVPGSSDTHFNDAHTGNYRLKINARPTDKLDVELLTWFSRAFAAGSSEALDDGTNAATIDEPTLGDFDAFGLTITYDFSGISVQSATNYLDYTSSDIQDIGGVDTLYSRLDSKVFSQEVHVTSSFDGPWQWDAGLLYRKAKDTLLQDLPLFLAAPINWTDESESVAVFGELTRSYLDGDLDLTFGLRWFEDVVTVTELIRNTGVPGEPLVSAESTFNTVSPRAVLTWHPGDDLTVYGSYSQGFRSGFNQNPLVLTTAPEFPPVNEDTLNNYEIGVKGSSGNGGLVFDAALYYIDWSDVQQTIGVPIIVQGASVNLFAPINSGSASGVGLDFSVTVTPIDDVQLNLNLGWNDLTLDQDVMSGGALLFEKGDRLVDSPEYTGGLTGSYGFPFGGTGYRTQLSASVDYNSELVSRTVNSGVLLIGASDSILNTRFDFSVTSPEKRWITTVYVDNANNEDGAIQGRDPGEPRPRLRPRTIGVQVEYHY